MLCLTCTHAFRATELLRFSSAHKVLDKVRPSLRDCHRAREVEETEAPMPTARAPGGLFDGWASVSAPGGRAAAEGGFAALGGLAGLESLNFGSLATPAAQPLPEAESPFLDAVPLRRRAPKAARLH